MRSYLDGMDAVIGAEATPHRGVLITVRDVPALVRAQGGNTGAFVDQLVPDTIEATVYQQMAAEITAGMKDKGVDADVKVVSPAGYKPARGPEFKRGVVVGAGAIGVGWLVWKLLRGLL